MNYFRTHLIIFLLLFVIPLANAQTSFDKEKRLEKIDSLKTKLLSADDQEKAHLYNDLVGAFYNISFDSVFHYIQLAIVASKKAGNLEIEAIATKNLGLIYAARNDYLKAIETQKKAVEISESINDYDLQAVCLNNIGYICHQTFQLDLGLEYLFQGLKICEEETLEDKSTKGLILGNIAACYSMLDNQKTALYFLQQVIDYADEIDDLMLKIRHCDEISLVLSKNNLVEEAKESCLECLKISKESGYTEAQMNALSAMVEILFKQGAYQEALEYAEEYEQLGKKIRLKFMIPKILLWESKILGKQGNLSEAIFKANEAYNMSATLRPKHAASISNHLSQLYIETKDFEKAIHFQGLHLNWTKADQEQKVKYKAAELEAKYQTKNQQKQIDLLNQENKLNEQTNNLYKLGLGMLSLILLVVGRLFYIKRKTINQLANLNNELNKTQIELKDKHDDLEKYIASNTQLEQFAHVASHDLRAPIITIKSFSELLTSQSQNKLDKNEQTYLNYISTNATQILELVNDLLAYSKINAQKLNLQPTDLQILLKDVCAIFRQQINPQSIVLNLEKDFPTIVVDEVKLKRVFQNLISNAIKFSDIERKNIISIAFTEKEEFWIFSVADTGIGMKKHKVDIFQPYKRLHRKQEYQGTGLGLSICQRIIEQHDGTIDFDSQIGVGSRFYFTIPKLKKTLA